MIEIAHNINLVNFTSPCFTSYHHVLTNMIHDLTTLCASCHECFDYIKTLLHVISSIYRSLNRNTSSLRLVNTPSSRKRPTTLSSHKLYTQCFTSCYHEISNKIHDLTTLCASCHECFDYIKTFTHRVVNLTIPATQHFITSSRITSISSRKRHATLYVVTKIYTRIDR